MPLPPSAHNESTGEAEPFRCFAQGSSGRDAGEAGSGLRQSLLCKVFIVSDDCGPEEDAEACDSEAQSGLALAEVPERLTAGERHTPSTPHMMDAERKVMNTGRTEYLFS